MKTKLSKCSLTPPLGSWGAGLLLLLLFFTSCKSNNDKYDASGYFEAVETIVSAQASGQILSFNVEEGQELTAGQEVGRIDSTQIYLTLLQLKAQKGVVLSQKPNINSQTAVLKTQIATAKQNLTRVEKLFAGNAATQKQLEDAQSAVSVLEKQLAAQQTSLGDASATISKQTDPIAYQISQLQNQLEKTHIINPSNGTVLVKYAEPDEVTAIGKPLYKIADLSEIILRAYVTNDQLSSLKLGQNVKVVVAKGDDKTSDYQGKIEWISGKAEFTPKTIQTKDERANEVYAVKIRVRNDGFLRIGMYGEVSFKQ